jgi:aspartyl/asparaginyl beta-hydroxylase (cupin superfamily)
LLKTLPLADIDGLCPNVFFSSLQPHTHIPPHHGESNARLIAHLPLLVPEKCRIRVGFEEREWKIGETLIFDDTLLHEAVNDSDDLRVVLIFDLWNPLLTDDERRLASKLAVATRQFSG